MDIDDDEGINMTDFQWPKFYDLDTVIKAISDEGPGYIVLQNMFSPEDVQRAVDRVSEVGYETIKRVFMSFVQCICVGKLSRCVGIIFIFVS